MQQRRLLSLVTVFQRFLTWKPRVCSHAASVCEDDLLTVHEFHELVILFHSLYWSIHTKDESKHRTPFAFIFGVNWCWRCGVTASFGVFFHEIKCNGMTSFMEFMIYVWAVLYFIHSRSIRWREVWKIKCHRHEDFLQIWVWGITIIHRLLPS